VRRKPPALLIVYIGTPAEELKSQLLTILASQEGLNLV
jgi:hypothetical protein